MAAAVAGARGVRRARRREREVEVGRPRRAPHSNVPSQDLAAGVERSAASRQGAVTTRVRRDPRRNRDAARPSQAARVLLRTPDPGHDAASGSRSGRGRASRRAAASALSKERRRNRRRATFAVALARTRRTSGQRVDPRREPSTEDRPVRRSRGPSSSCARTRVPARSRFKGPAARATGAASACASSTARASGSGARARGSRRTPRRPRRRCARARSRCRSATPRCGARAR